MIHPKGQSWQDLFAYETCGANGVYIEIGAAHPFHCSNTYALELEANWQGFSVELDNGTWQPVWQQFAERKNKIYWEDAMTFDYKTALQENNLPLHVNYVSCDIEPPDCTFTALQQLIYQGITFDCLTFEHDFYCYKEKNYNLIATNFLIENGYVPVVLNVYPIGTNDHYETWFVKASLANGVENFTDWFTKKAKVRTL